MFLLVLEGHVGHHRGGHAHAEVPQYLLPGGGADVDAHVLYGGLGLALGLAHKVGGLAGGDAGDIVPGGRLNPNPVGGDVGGNPAAQGGEAQGAVGLDGLHHEGHLVGVGVQLNHGPSALVPAAGEVEVAQAVLPEGAQPLAVAAQNRENLVLKAGRALGVGEGGAQFQ